MTLYEAVFGEPTQPAQPKKCIASYAGREKGTVRTLCNREVPERQAMDEPKPGKTCPTCQRNL